ncbi:unnamed protein product [Rhodiola kirilowii]
MGRSSSHFADGYPVMGQESNGGNQEDANFVGRNNQGNDFTFGSSMNRWHNPNQNKPNLSYKPQNQSQQPKHQESGSSSTPESLLTSCKAERDRRRKGVEQTLEQLAIQNKMLENQIAQQVNSVSREPRKLSSKPDPNPRASVNAITVRGGKQNEILPAQATRPPTATSAPISTPAEEATSKEAGNRARNSAQIVEPASYRPPVPFPQRLAVTKIDKAFK